MDSSKRPGQTSPTSVPDEATGAGPTSAPDAEPAGACTADGSPGRALNGSFLDSYDVSRAEPLGLDASEWYRRQGSRAPGTALVLQSTEASEAGPGSGSGAVPELILDEDNLLPFHFLRTGDRLGRAVVKIQRGDGAAGTGFLVAPGILMTNHHVLPDAAVAAAAQAHSNYEVSPPPEPCGRAAIVPLRPDLLFLTESELDVTFCGVEGLEDLGVVPLGRDSLNILPSESVNIIQHPRGRPKEVALQDNRVVKVDNVVLRYSCDTEPGSSGSPVFNNLWQLVALHHASVVTDAAEGLPARGLNPNSRFLNEGIRISAIAVWLEMLEPATPEACDQADRLRALFEGVDPQIGFFGALGRRTAARSAAEAIVECYHGDDNDLDLAFWNLTNVTIDSRENFDEIGWVITHMKADAWCLTHTSGDVLSALCEHMQSRYRLNYRRLHEGDSGEPPTALLYRRAGMLSAGSQRLEPSAGAARGSRLLLRAADGRGRTATVALVPVLRGRQDRSRALDMAVHDPTAELLFVGDGLNPRELHTLSSSGVPLRAALGPDGAFALLASDASPFARVFASPNLELAYGLSSDLVVARNRRWPEPLATLGGRRPIALRLSFAQPSSRVGSPAHEAPKAKPWPTPGETHRADPPGLAPAPPHLVQALREFLTWFEDEHRRIGEKPPGS